MNRVKLEEGGCRLVVHFHQLWRLGWAQLDVGSIVSAYLGEIPEPQPLGALALKICQPMADGTDISGFYWNTQSGAIRALKAVRAAVEAGGEPWPDWSLKAKEAGWKPPKGWRP
jgi:hypothetical protein